MTIFVRVASGIRDHLPVRLNEWLSVYPALYVGLALYLHPDLFSTSTAYQNMAAWLNEEWWSVVFLLCATLRLLALTINGTFHSFKWTPLIRMGVSIIVGFSWGQLCVGFFQEFISSGRAIILTGMLSHMVLSECLNCYRASVDFAESNRARSRVA